MLNQMAACMTCRDNRHYEMKVDEARQIAASIKKVVDKYTKPIKEEDERKYYYQLDFDKQHQHFLCGHCHKINEMALPNAEHELKTQLARFCVIIEKDWNSVEEIDYRMTLRHLSGRYPGMYKVLERHWNRS